MGLGVWFGFGRMAFEHMVLGAWFWAYVFGRMVLGVWLWGDGFGCMALGVWLWEYSLALGVWLLGIWFWAYGFGRMVIGVWFWAYGFRRIVWTYDFGGTALQTRAGQAQKYTLAPRYPGRTKS